MNFADFRANFCVFFFDNYFVLLAEMGIEETPSTWAKLMITIVYNFVGKNHFFVEKYDKKMAKIGTIFLNFFAVFRFSVFS